MCFPRRFLRVIFTYLIISSSEFAYAQGAWDIGYILPSSLDSNFLGKKIRIDFRKNKTDTLEVVTKRSIRSLLSTSDSIDLLIGNTFIRFAEDWKLYVDHGVVAEQSLTQIGTKLKRQLIIREMKLYSISIDSILIEATIYDRYKNPRQQLISIPRDYIKAVLITIE